MKTKAVRLYGKNDLRFEEFELPKIKEDEILAKIVSDSICMSSYKMTIQGSDHKRVPKDIDKNPIIVGHEFCGELLEIGEKWKDKFREGQKFIIQPSLNIYKNGVLLTPGYSYKYMGGNATYIIIPNEVMEQDCLIPYNGKSYFYGSLAEPMTCIIGAFNASYHTRTASYVHDMGIKEDGNMAILAGVGPMGLGMIDYAIHNERKPKLLVVTDIDQERLERASEIYTAEEAAKHGIKLIYVNTANMEDARSYLLELTNGKAYDDVFVLAPVSSVVELGDSILAKDGCLNFFAGPPDASFKANINFYNIHYNSTHYVGTSGGNNDDLLKAVELIEKGIINPAAMITHIGGLNSAAHTTLNLPKIPGGKKLIYTHIDMDLTAISDFKEKGKDDPLFAALAEIVEKHNNLWNEEAEEFLLKNAKPI